MITSFWFSDFLRRNRDGLPDAFNHILAPKIESVFAIIEVFLVSLVALPSHTIVGYLSQGKLLPPDPLLVPPKVVNKDIWRQGLVRSLVPSLDYWRMDGSWALPNVVVDNWIISPSDSSGSQTTVTTWHFQ